MTKPSLPETFEDALTECSLLRRCLVKVSYAASGTERRVDKALADLRNLIKKEASVEDITAQVDKIADLLRRLEDRVEALDISDTDLLRAFQTQLLGECPEHEKAIKRVFSRYQDRGWVTLITQLYNVIGPTEQKEGFWQRLFGTKPEQSKEQVKTEDHTGSCKRVRATLLGLLEQLSIPKALEGLEKELTEKIENLTALDETPELLNLFSEFVLELTSIDHVRFQRFLTSLGIRLQQVAELVDASVGIAGQHEAAANQLDAQMRAHVDELQTDLRRSGSLVELQRVFEERFDDIIRSLNQYREVTSRLFSEQKASNDKLRTALAESRAQLKTLREALAEKQRLAETDPLTAVGNRYHFDQVLQTEYGRWRRYREPLSLVLIDLDHFKNINDMFGHQAGDEVLKAVASVIRARLRQTDLLARYGGEEFVVLMPQTSLAAATKAANKLRMAIRETQIQTSAGTLTVTASMGVAEFDGSDTPEDVLARADQALYRAKRKGRNMVCAQLSDGDVQAARD